MRADPQPSGDVDATYSGGRTLWSRAHASFSSLVKQQQCRQHSSAFWQPQA